jgi:hypothetical protein
VVAEEEAVWTTVSPGRAMKGSPRDGKERCHI